MANCCSLVPAARTEYIPSSMQHVCVREYINILMRDNAALHEPHCIDMPHFNFLAHRRQLAPTVLCLSHVASPTLLYRPRLLQVAVHAFTPIVGLG